MPSHGKFWTELQLSRYFLYVNWLHYFLSDPVSYPQPGDPIPRGCSKELLDRYPGLPDQLDNQMKTMIKIDFEGAAATCQ